MVPEPAFGTENPHLMPDWNLCTEAIYNHHLSQMRRHRNFQGWRFSKEILPIWNDMLSLANADPIQLL